MVPLTPRTSSVASGSVVPTPIEPLFLMTNLLVPLAEAVKRSPNELSIVRPAKFVVPEKFPIAVVAELPLTSSVESADATPSPSESVKVDGDRLVPVLFQ